MANDSFRVQLKVTLAEDFITKEEARRAAMARRGVPIAPLSRFPEVVTVKYGGQHEVQSLDEAIAKFPTICAERWGFQLQPGDIISIPSGDTASKLSTDSYESYMETQRGSSRRSWISAVFNRQEIDLRAGSQKRARTRLSRLADAKRRKGGSATFLRDNEHLILAAECLGDEVILGKEIAAVEVFKKCAGVFSWPFFDLLKKKTHGFTRGELIARFRQLSDEKRKEIWEKCAEKRAAVPKGVIPPASLLELENDIALLLDDQEGAVQQAEGVEEVE